MRHHETKQDRFADYARQVIESSFNLHVSGTPEGETPSGKMFVVSLLAYLDECGFHVARKPVGADEAVTQTGLPKGSAAGVGNEPVAGVVGLAADVRSLACERRQAVPIEIQMEGQSMRLYASPATVLGLQAMLSSVCEVNENWGAC